jgi:cyclase
MRTRWTLALLLAWVSSAQAQQRNFDDVQIKATHVAGAVSMLEGAGGNIGVCAGPDGVFLIDDQFAPLTDKIRDAVAKIQTGPIRFVLNTHWHGDHTGGNENLGKAGVLIVAHDNVRVRMASEQFSKIFDRKTPASPAPALPVVTFTEAVTFYLNGDEIHAFHVPPAHTDGDAIVHFRRANVVHAGDVFFNGNYPVIDLDSGGSVEGVIAAVDRIVAVANAETRIIPGHGPIAGLPELQAYRKMLIDVRDAVKKAVADGKSLEDTQKAKPSAAYDAAWGNGFIKPDKFVEIVYTDLSRNR